MPGIFRLRLVRTGYARIVEARPGYSILGQVMSWKATLVYVRPLYFRLCQFK